MVVVQGQPGGTDHLVEAVQLAEVRHWKKGKECLIWMEKARKGFCLSQFHLSLKRKCGVDISNVYIEKTSKTCHQEDYSFKSLAKDF